jgi:hypothetical protein
LADLDPQSRLLLRVSKEEIVNVSFFEELSKSSIRSVINHPGMDKIKSVEVSINNGMNNFRQLIDIYKKKHFIT